MKLDRRDFLYLAGGAAGGAAAGRLSLRGLSRLNEALAPEMASYPGEEKWVHSICRLCPGGCGLRVRTMGGRPVKVNGNPLYPVNREGICSRGQALLQWLYHPDRILQPQWRSNTRQKYEAISWEKALEILTAQLRKLSVENRQSGLVVVSGRGAGLTRSLLSRFLSLYGSNPLFCLPVGTETAQQALELMAGSSPTGGGGRMAYDLENSRTVLNFGCDLLEGWGTPAHTLALFGRWRDGSNGRRTTLVHFGSRLSVSAARANQWVPVEPGTLGAVALGLAYVLISEDLYNRDFIENYTAGFEDWTDSAGRQRIGFRTLVREEYRISRVAEMTGVPPETLVRIARQFASGQGAVAIGPQQSPAEPGRLFDAMAIHSLNALVGSIGAQGGVAILPERGWPLPAEDDTPEQPSPSLEELLRALEAPPEILLLDEAAFLLELLNPSQREMLERIPLVVTTSPLQDGTTIHANLVLPDCTPLESWVDGQAPPSFPHELLALAEPVLPPRGESRPWGETILALARSLDPAISEALPWNNFPDLLRASAERVAQNQRGYLFGSEVDESWQRLLERGGWWAPDWNSPEQFWQGLQANGGWWDPASWPAEPQRLFQTPSGRFEFYSLKLEELLRQQNNALASSPDSSPDASFDTPRDWDHRVLPHHTALLPASGSKQFHLLLEPYDTLPFYRGGGGTIPFLQQISSPMGGAEWQSCVEMSEEDARHRDIHNGDTVWVESAAGRIRRRALVIEGAMPGIVGAPRGGAPQAGRWVSREESLADILVPLLDPVLGTRSSADTLVNIYKV